MKGMNNLTSNSDVDMGVDPYNLRPVWDAILDLYKRFDAYCKKYQLRYYVTGGTLLGAVRHDGFIPWDDDFDVVMPRPDYQRFLELVKSDRIANAQIVAKELDLSWSQWFAKVFETRQDVINRIKDESRLDLSDGICIDVIPIDGMPKATLPFYYWVIKRSTWRHARKGFVWKILWGLLWGREKDAASFFSFERWLASYPYDSSPAVEDYNANGRRFRMRALTATSFGEPVWHKFDCVKVPMPQAWERFLGVIFGDWRQLPPVEKRVPSHQALVGVR